MIVAAVFGARDAIHQYRWHRKLPINYFLATECEGYPDELTVVFDVRLAEKVKADSAKQRQALADQIYGDYRDETQQFGHPNFIHYWPNQYEYRQTYSSRVRELVKERIKARFFESNPSAVSEMSDNEFEACGNSLMSWLRHQDPLATEFVAKWLDDENLSLNRKRYLLRSTRWSTRDVECLEPLRSHAKQLIDQPGFGEACMEIAIRLNISDVQENIEQRIIELKEFENSELDSEGFGQLKSKLIECLSMISQSCNLQCDAQSLELLRTIEPLVASYYAKLEKRQSGEVQYGTIERVNYYFDLALANCQRGEIRSEAALIAYQINDMNNFLLGANAEHTKEFEYVLTHRDALTSPSDPKPDRFRYSSASLSAKEMRENSDVRSLYQEDWDNFKSALPNKLSGHETDAPMTRLLRAATKMESAVAKKHLLELMAEEVPQAFSFSGLVFGGTEDADAIELMKKKLTSIEDGEDEYFLEEFDVHDVLWQISPIAANEFNYSTDELEMASKIASKDELKQLLAQFEFEIPDDLSSSVQKSDEGLFLQNRANEYLAYVESVFEHNKRFSLVRDFSNSPTEQNMNPELKVSRNDNHTHILELFDSVAHASNGIVKPNVRYELDASKKRVQLDVELNGIVYQFEIPNRGENDFVGKTVCDILNHILMRQQIEERFAPVRSRFFFAKPEMLKELHERFGISFERGAEHYWNDPK